MTAPKAGPFVFGASMIKPFLAGVAFCALLIFAVLYGMGLGFGEGYGAGFNDGYEAAYAEEAEHTCKI